MKCTDIVISRAIFHLRLTLALVDLVSYAPSSRSPIQRTSFSCSNRVGPDHPAAIAFTAFVMEDPSNRPQIRFKPLHCPSRGLKNSVLARLKREGLILG